MALVVADRVQETGTVSTGTGSVNLAGAVNGYKSFITGVGTTNTTYYCIYDPLTFDWEVGYGTVTAGSPNTLSRTTVLSNSLNTTALISFSTTDTLTVFCTYPSERAIYADANNNVTLPAALTVTNDANIHGVTVGLGAGAVASNMAVGTGALASNTTGGTNTAIGQGALSSTTTTYGATAVGYNAAYYQTGGNNDAFGIFALLGIAGVSTGIYNSAFGQAALFGNTTGNNNVAVGYQTLYSNTIGNNNTAMGFQALYNNSAVATSTGTITGGSGYTNGVYVNVSTSPVSGGTFTTYPTVNVTVSGGVVTAVSLSNGGSGASSLGPIVLTVTSSLIGGSGSGFSFQVYCGAGGFNAAVGYQALYNNTGSTNTAIGYQSAYSNTTGSSNVAEGYKALYYNTVGTGNTAIGYQAAYSNTTIVSTLNGVVSSGGSGYTNGTYTNVPAVVLSGPTYIVNPTLNITVSGGAVTSATLASGGLGASNGFGGRLTVNNSSIGGTGSGFSVLVLGYYSGTANTAVGSQALNTNITGSGNTAIGNQALYNTTGGNNTAIGYQSGNAITTGAYNVVIGPYTGAAAPISYTGNNYVVLSDGQANIRGYFDSSNNFVVGGTSTATAAGVIYASRFVSNVATGTAPFTVTSTTPVANLSIGGNAATATTASSATSAGYVNNSLYFGSGFASNIGSLNPSWNGGTSLTVNAVGTTIYTTPGMYSLSSSDAGKTIVTTSGGITVSNTGMQPGYMFSIYNNSTTSQTITQGTGVTMYWAGQSSGSTGNRTLGGYGICTILFISTTTVVISGAGLT